MATHKSPLSRDEKASGKFEEGKQGLSTKEKGKVVPQSEHVPSNRAYLKMSKAQFVAEMTRLKERKLAINAAAAEFDAKKDAKIDEIKEQKSAPAPEPKAEKQKKKSKKS